MLVMNRPGNGYPNRAWLLHDMTPGSGAALQDPVLF